MSSRSSWQIIVHTVSRRLKLSDCCPCCTVDYHRYHKLMFGKKTLLLKKYRPRCRQIYGYLCHPSRKSFVNRLIFIEFFRISFRFI